MKKKLYGIGTLLIMAAVLLCTSYRQGVDEQREKIEREKNRIDQCYGYYWITDFKHETKYNIETFLTKTMTYNDRVAWLENQLLTGKIITIQPELLIIYDAERLSGSGKYYDDVDSTLRIFMMENPSYGWRGFDGDNATESFKSSQLHKAVGDNYFSQLDGIMDISPSDGTTAKKYFYTLEDKDKLIMRSATNNEYFVLERCSEELTNLLSEWNIQESPEFLQGVYGEYRVTDYFPTKFQKDVPDDANANKVVGRTVSISKDMFIAYKETTTGVGEEEIEEPDYRVKSVWADELYGIWDGMIPDELQMQQYVEIYISPGYRYRVNERDGSEIRMYLTGGGRILLYALETYFLLEKAPETEEESLSAHYGSYRVTDFYPASKDERRYRVKYDYHPDKLLGRVFHIKSGRLITYHTPEYKGMDRSVLEYPEYHWESLTSEESDGILREIPGLAQRASDNRLGQLDGLMIVSDAYDKSASEYDGYFYFYAFTDRETLLMSVDEGIFLLERCGENEVSPILEWSRQKGDAGDLSAWVGKYTYSEGYTDYGIEIYREEDGEYYADIEKKMEIVNMNVKLKAYVCEGAGRIFLVFKECSTGGRGWEWENRWGDVLLSFRKDPETGDIYTYWGELDRTKESGNICFE